MTDQPTNGGPKPRTRTRAEERAEAVSTPSRVELAERVEELERQLAETTAKAEETSVPAEEQTNLDLWKAMDEGRDPTA